MADPSRKENGDRCDECPRAEQRQWPHHERDHGEHPEGEWRAQPQEKNHRGADRDLRGYRGGRQERPEHAPHDPRDAHPVDRLVRGPAMKFAVAIEEPVDVARARLHSAYSPGTADLRGVCEAMTTIVHASPIQSAV